MNMAPLSKRQKAPASVIPVVPRIFEARKSNGVSKPVTSAKEPALEPGLRQEPKTTPDTSHETAIPANLAEATDWASLAAEEDPVDTPVSTPAPDNQPTAEPDTALVETPKAEEKVNGSLGSRSDEHEREPAVLKDNGYHDRHENLQFTPRANGHQPHMPHRGPRHAPGYPPGFGPNPPRASPHIAFGSFGGTARSDDSSPTLPPSATSTHFTQPTPLSDTHSHTSRGGHTNAMSNGSVVTRMPFPSQDPATATFEPRFYHRPELVSAAVAEFNSRNRNELLAIIQQDLFAAGPTELNLSVSTRYGSDTFRVMRAACRRSPELSRLLDKSSGSSTDLGSSSQWVTVESVRAVILSLYGNSLIDLNAWDGHIRRTLEIIATAHVLAANLAIGFGIDLATKVMHWQSLLQSLHFCLEIQPYESGNGRSADLLPLENIIPPCPRVTILSSCIHCILSEINGKNGLFFDEHAIYFSELGGGFPPCPAPVSLPGHGQSTSRQIQFGHVEGDYDRDRNLTLSSILLSLPLTVLQHVLAHVLDVRIVHAVVQAREKRRLAAVEAASASYHARFQESVMSLKERNGLRTDNGLRVISRLLS